MPLPSQQPRSGMRATNFSRGGGGRRRARRRRWGALLTLMALVVVGWWMWPGGDGKTPLEPRQASGGGVSPSLTPARSERNAPPSDRATPVDEGGSALAARTEQRLTRAAESVAGTKPEPVATSKAAPEPPARPVASEPDPTPPTTETTPASPEPAPRSASSPGPSGGLAAQALARAEAAILRNDPVEARDILNCALHDHATAGVDRAALREMLGEVAQILTLSPRVYPGDATADAYTVQPGDVLAAIPRREGFRIDYRLIQRLNKLANPNMIRPGQKLKVLYGPFHAVIDKSDFRLDIYADQRDTAGNRFYVCSFPVGLGEYGLTPVGKFRVPPSGNGEKLIDPAWVNPRTNEKFAADDPKNPIGERWIPIEGIDEATRDLRGYGIHGTVEPESIGREMSMGCVRMLPDDVALVYELLVAERSLVEIVE